MPYSIGDILLKVDERATSATVNTRHHVMLVVEESENNVPIVMHMLGEPHWKLVKEELTRGKDLIKVHYSWPKETREAIAQAAESSLKEDNFVLTKKIIENQCSAISPYRPIGSLEAALKLTKLKKAFADTKDKSVFTPCPESTIDISCHEWVINVIHYACRQTGHEILLGLQIPPHLAWADRLYSMVKDDPDSSCSLLKNLGFFGPPKGLATIASSPAKDTGAELTIVPTSIFSFFASFFSTEEELYGLDPGPSQGGGI